jgi:hypothetical protein
MNTRWMWKEPRLRSRLETGRTAGKPRGGSDARTSVRERTATSTRSAGIPSGTLVEVTVKEDTVLG